MTEKIEFDTTNPSLIDSKNNFKVAITHYILAFLKLINNLKAYIMGFKENCNEFG